MTQTAERVEAAVRESLQTVRPDAVNLLGSTDLARELGMDSVQVMDMVMEIEDRLDISRSEERRVGKECRRLCRSRWSPYH
jgi:acyl carrier protein